ncbi:ADP-ribosylglycohydrolase family protein [Aureisphaera galaxeae]|uniref:ADP-ribosylglycohydrolase family protein n=1 Tax=Aureisphaera galaxeae TaxID=1538023 RepID=UPI002350BB4A|nr:ADP-ribosylglycohydrolase family protein [Aureisphaera galaxeae]MDC8004322.1 ADP-ribosylglycohydrolase family protein [Aureisphaera galaxeae]
MSLLNNIRGGVYGVAVGDALGVPYEFLLKDDMEKRPATTMVGHGSHNQPPGTWSDDSSLTFCLMEGLMNGYNTHAIAEKFIAWYDDAYWTPHGTVFDIGVTTRQAIFYMKKGHTPEICGGMDEYSNGNGSLMRILPLVFLLEKEGDIQKRFQMVKDISSMTHAHLRSVLACYIYLEYALQLMETKDKFKAYQNMKTLVNAFLATQDLNPKEIGFYFDVLEYNVNEIQVSRISGSGYVVNSLKASLWCLLNTDSYKEAVLAAVNLGEDTDTTAAITGGLAGLYYGVAQIPKEWIQQLARYGDIEDLILRFEIALKS